MISSEILNWLLDSDVSIQYQVHRDLLNTNRPDLKARISEEGWGAKLLSCRGSNGQWGRGFYQPKWTSTHYSLLDLKNLSVSNQCREAQQTINIIICENKAPDGGINPAKTIPQSDVCICGMFLNYASYFGANQDDLKSVVDFLLEQQMGDGGFNCQSNFKGANHSSLHTTISVVEGIHEYAKAGYKYRLDELQKAEKESQEFMLEHKLFKSSRTGKTIDNKMIKLPYPSRWHYDILRAFDYFRLAGLPFEIRMSDALEILKKKRRSDGTWPLQSNYPGQVHFEMESVGKSSRWNTLRALRVLLHFDLI